MFSSVQDYQRQGICAMGAHLDVAVYNISQALKENDMWDNTLFIFANDNGEKLYPNPGTPYDGVTQIGLQEGQQMAMRVRITTTTPFEVEKVLYGKVGCAP